MVRALTEPAALQELERLAGAVELGSILELGVYQGASLAALSRGARGARVFGIDPWGMPGPGERYNRLRARYGPANMVTAAEAAPRATLIRGFSTDVAQWWAEPIELLYIDALHELDAVRADVAAWAGHLLPGATVAFDDYSIKFPGVIEAVEELGREVRVVGTRLAVVRW